MLDAIRAEALKFRRHRATWLMVWIYPVAFAAATAIQLIRDITHIATPGGMAATPSIWVAQSVVVWGAPLSGGGRFLIAGFAALAFAGEYGWNTWKLIIPARPRWQLVAAKWIVAFGFVFAAYGLADALSLTASFIRPYLGGPAIPDGVTFSALARAHGTAAVHAVLPVAYTIAWAGLIATLTTSVLATVIVSIALITVEQLLLPIAILAYNYAAWITIPLLYILPFYHLANVIAWTRGAGLTIPLGTSSLSLAWPISAMATSCWIAGAGAASILRFNRQDLN